MRTATVLVSLSILSWSPPAEANQTILVLPFEGTKHLIGDVGHALQLRALGTLSVMGDMNVLHPKQLNRASELHGYRLRQLPTKVQRKELATILGADWVVSGTYEKTKKGASISFEVRLPAGGIGGKKSVSARTLIDALDPFSKELAALMKRVGAHQGALPSATAYHPRTRSEAALVEYAGCFRIMIEQPVGIRTPKLLDAGRLNAAIQHCKEALKQDAKLEDAKAALGFLYAMKGDRLEAEKYLGMVKDSKLFLPMYWVGKFWVVSRHHDIDAAVATLEAAVQEKSGFLLARGYLGDTLIALRRYEAAKGAFEQYLERAPKQPWVMGRLGYVHSKLGDTAKAIEWTKKALRVAPSDSELLLEMASRYVDAQKYDDAISILQRLIAENRARGEVHLRLGYALLKKGQLPRAERELHAAIQKATALSDWRTRGRARYDLAKIWMQSGIVDNALRQLRMAIEEGYRDKRVFESDPDFKPLLANAEFKRLMAGPSTRADSLPQHASPFRLDPESGNIDLSAAPKAKKPNSTVILTF